MRNFALLMLGALSRSFPVENQLCEYHHVRRWSCCYSSVNIAFSDKDYNNFYANKRHYLQWIGLNWKWEKAERRTVNLIYLSGLLHSPPQRTTSTTDSCNGNWDPELTSQDQSCDLLFSSSFSASIRMVNLKIAWKILNLEYNLENTPIFFGF